MSGWKIGSSVLIILFTAAGCSSAPKPQAASATDQSSHAQPTLPVSATQVNVDSSISRACHLPTPKFAFDSAAVNDQSALDALAQCFTNGPLKGRDMKLIGHADPRGETEYNFVLGQKRAGDVQQYLEQRGVEQQKIGTLSRGELDATGTNESGWAQDRRVDVMLAD